MYVLDTNVVSELRKVRAGKAEPDVATWAEKVDAADLIISVITIMELELDVFSFERKDAAQGAILRAWLEQHVLRNSPSEHCPLILSLRNVVPGCMFPTNATSGMRLLRRRPLCMA